MTPYDRRTLGRTIVMASALCMLAYGVMFASDGAMTTASEKFVRLAMLSPLLGGIGALLANAQARSRGEARALAALGVHPTRACLGALLGTLMVGLAGAAALTLGSGHLNALFPRLDDAAWVALPGGGWDLPDAGVRISAIGDPQFMAATAVPAGSGVDRAPVVVCVLWMTLVLVDWVRDEIGAWERLGATLLAGGARSWSSISSPLVRCRVGRFS